MSENAVTYADGSAKNKLDKLVSALTVIVRNKTERQRNSEKTN